MSMSLSRAARVPVAVRKSLSRSLATGAEVHSRKPLVDLKPEIREKAENLSASWKGTTASGGNTKNYIGGQFVESRTDKWIDVHDPVRVSYVHFSCRVHRYTDSLHNHS